MRFAFAATLAGAALTMGATACGGGDDDGLSKSELAKEANAICTDFKQEMAALPRAPARSPEAIAQTVARSRGVLRGTVDELEKLDPGDAAKGDWENYVDTENEAVRLLDTFLKQVTSRDRGAQQTLVQINAIVGRERSAALRIGADACASKPGAGQVSGGTAP